jgi:peroxiredoxin
MSMRAINPASCGLLIGAAVLAFSPIGIIAEAADSPLGRPAPEFQLTDLQEIKVSLSDFHEARLVVVAFLGTECPLAKLYGPRLNQLATEYASKGVRFVGVDSNLQDTPAKMAAYAREHHISFPLLHDPGNRVADKFGAVRTPEVFLLDGRRIIRYHGRVDDQYGVGLQKPKPTRRDLAEAIEELLAGKPVSQPALAAAGCQIGRATKPDSAAAVTYSKHIAPILQRRCLECHRKGEIAPFPLTTYREVLGWGGTIREVVEEGRMPPWFADPAHGKFANDARLSAEEKQQIVRWVEAGCPEGDRKDLPPPRKFLDGWNIPQPDLVVKMSDKPFRVPAEGVVPYQNFVVDPGFTEDKWIVASEARPGNRAVVHHILVFLKKPGQMFPAELMRGSLIGAYAPGAPGRKLSPGMAKRIPAGSKIIFQMHYTPNGSEQDDLSFLGLKFCDAKEVRQEIESGASANLLVAIPPRAKDHQMVSQFRFSEDRLLFNMTPHMHLRGKSFRYEAIYPDGHREILLDVPRWDFNWQIEYELAEPKPMPKGTILKCTARYDNSADNPANPAPDQWVWFGEQTWDEMMIGWFVSATPPGARGK